MEETLERVIGARALAIGDLYRVDDGRVLSAAYFDSNGLFSLIVVSTTGERALVTDFYTWLGEGIAVQLTEEQIKKLIPRLATPNLKIKSLWCPFTNRKISR